jgi:Flp pilus assembly pilin Flp
VAQQSSKSAPVASAIGGRGVGLNGALIPWAGGRNVAHFTEWRSMHMEKFNRAVRKFVTDDGGAALAEYGILVALIAIVAILAVTFFGSRISSKFSLYANQIP